MRQEIVGKRIGVSVYTFADENGTLLAAQIQDAAEAAGLDWHIEIRDAGGTAGQAKASFEAFIRDGCDAIVDLITHPRDIPDQLAAAKEADIPVFGLFTNAPRDPGFVIDYSGSTAADSVFVNQYMVEDQVRRKPTAERITVGLLDTDIDVIRIRKPLVEALLSQSEYGRFDVVAAGSVDPSNIEETAQEAVARMLEDRPDLDALWTVYSPVALIAARAIERAGRSDRTQVYGHIVGSAGLEAIRDGRSALVATSWIDLVYCAWGIVDFMLNHFVGNPIDRLAYMTTRPVPVAIIDQDEAGSPNVRRVASIGGSRVLTWMYNGGEYRQSLIDCWRAQFAA